MSWINALREVYDNCESLVGVIDDRGVKGMLMPIAHITCVAQIEIVIDKKGNFIRASRLSKDEGMTLIPVTEDSASRSSGIAPHPLHDNLQYVAGDYDTELHTEEKNSKKEYHNQYMDALLKWCQEPGACEEVSSIYNYLSKNTLISDLRRTGTYDNEKDFVRFAVVDTSDPGFVEKQSWEKTELIDNYISHYLKTLTTSGIDYATGEVTAIATKYPRKIRNAGDSAQIISSNDTRNFTYRGRFKNADEASEIGYISSQKIHSALRWLFSRQGKIIESESIVCFSTGGERVPDVTGNSFQLFEDDDEQYPETSERFAMNVNNAIDGYRTNLNHSSKVVVMAVDTADGGSKGRLSIVYYSEQIKNDFLDNLEKWHIQCRWKQLYKKKDGNYASFLGAPSLREIARSAFGTEQNGMLAVDAKIQKKVAGQLLPCITQGKRFPKDILRAMVRNAGEPQRFSSFNYNTILTNTCAIIHKCRKDDNKEDYDMELREDSEDRDYLFGRLLAVFDRIESVVNFKEGTKRSTTNAYKYWSAYAKKPARTAVLIREKLNPYLQKMEGGQKNFYERKIGEILVGLEKCEGYNNNPLRDLYLLGFYSQAEFFKQKKNDEENEND